MPITVQEIVNLPIFNTAKVRTGIEILDKRDVEWMSAIEGPVENFVRKQEFVLTTGMGCENEPELLFQFVKDVYESGASALGIAIGRYIFDIPDTIIDFAEEKRFVLIELPWELRFADIQRETMKEINRRQESFSEKARQTQKMLIDFVIHGKDLSEIIKFVERELYCAIVFADSKGRAKSSGADPEKMIDLWYSFETDDEINMDESSFRHIQKVAYEDGYLLKKEITSGSRNLAQGYFIILMKNKNLLTNNALQVMESLSAATALWISREDAIVKTEIRLRNEFIWGLAKTPQMIFDDNIQSRAKLFGYNLNVPYICMVGYSENFDSFSEGQYGGQDFGFKNIIYYIEEEVRYAASVVNKTVAFTFDDDRLIIYLESKNEEHSTVHHFLDLVDKRLNALIPGVLFSWGIGMHLDGIMQFHESYKKASSALDMGRKQKGPGQRISFEDTQLNRLLLHLANNHEVRDITLATIAPLIEYEQKREMDLIDTFIAYDNQNGNVSQAARILNLHRQSLLYRLRKIESLTNLSLDNPDDVFLLNISIKVWLTGALKTTENFHYHMDS
ncbi:PucR family transcriptional regulator [Pseudogracilibacillus auburnensis]|uniref:PucR family transcriptional regulator n=1 Tax=Pseudogracilibacillus auburnensis TaxID=1494959 RepID=UPI001A97C0F5|nr:PucR family transcriptional regulator [Pseudogracilibacillus auburnensis]MBO1002107.1 PucR family transcriptional regulator ligand-binding domain-containing protein [Pseudogracilibacillus auburnensis]